MGKVRGLTLAGETLAPTPLFILALLKYLQGGEERKEGGIWREEHWHSVEEMHFDNWRHADELWITNETESEL